MIYELVLYTLFTYTNKALEKNFEPISIIYNLFIYQNNVVKCIVSVLHLQYRNVKFTLKLVA